MTTPAEVSISHAVHYVETSDGSGGALCRAGIVTAHGPANTVSVTVIQGSNFYAVDMCAFDDDTRLQGTWHWPSGTCGS